MNTNKKYTVILSAEIASNSATDNLIATENLALYLRHVLKLKIDSAIGCYKGFQETSFVIHTNRVEVAQGLIHYGLKYLGQECILVSRNADADIKLFFADTWKAPQSIGRYFVPNKDASENYTILKGTKWSVAL